MMPNGHSHFNATGKRHGPAADPKVFAYENTVGPNVPFGPVGNWRGIPIASNVFIHTVLPHQLRLIPPLGNCRQKKMKMRAMAVPESRAAERM